MQENNESKKTPDAQINVRAFRCLIKEGFMSGVLGREMRKIQKRALS